MLRDGLAFLMGPDETLQGSRGGGGAALPRADHGLLARLGARPLHPLRMAGRDHPRGDHPQARRVRRHRRGDRGAHDLDSRVPGQRAQLGLPLLLAARRLLRRERAQPPERHADDGALPRLHHQRGRGQRRRTCSPSTASAGAPTSRSASSTSLPGYRGMGPVRVGNQAYRQVQNDVYGSAILAATHAFFDRRLAARGQRGALPPPRGPRRAGGARCTRAPTRACGSCAAPRTCTRSRA